MVKKSSFAGEKSDESIITTAGFYISETEREIETEHCTVHSSWIMGKLLLYVLSLLELFEQWHDND